LSEVGKALNESGVSTTFFHIGTDPVRGCIACRGCKKTGYCAFDDDGANACIDSIKQADGVVIGTPVYYASANGALCALLDRVFFSAGGSFRGKPAAAIASCRRGGAGSAFDRLNKYFTISEMPLVSSQYWNAVHGNTPEEVGQDLEGLQIMRTLGRNMAWLLSGIKNAAPLPEREPRVATNFIRTLVPPA
jgi:multimeric flavodoxin WrbA